MSGINRLIKTVLMGIIRGYQLLISPILGPRCRFMPTCSQYALEALRIHGILRGVGLTIKRIGRCHPGSEGGYDPVPPYRSSKE